MRRASRFTTGRAAAGGAAALLLAGTAQAAAFKAVLLLPADDARLERSRVERAYFGHPTGPAGDGVAAALKEARMELDAAGASLTLETVAVANAAEARAAAQKAEKAGAVALLADLPADALLAAADAVKLPVLNVSAAGDRLRQQDCRARLYHVAPSERMRADALAQTLVARKWSQVLLLTGPTPADAERSFRPIRASVTWPTRCCSHRVGTTWSGWWTATVSLPAACPTAPPRRGRWWATPGWWRWPGMPSSSAMVRRRSAAALPARPNAA
jgi:hypothetical protein